MRLRVLPIAAALMIASAAGAQTPAPAGGLSGLSFLVGSWSSGRGVVADTGGTSTGRSTITVETGGAALLRRDHTDLFDASGKPVGGFDQIMLIYPEGDTVRADYTDGTHVIHYVSAQIDAGKAATFTSAPEPTAPTFRLRYELSAPTTLTVSFAMAPPGSADFRPIATGSLSRGS